MSENNPRNPQNFKQLLKHCNAVQEHLENNMVDMEEAKKEMSTNPQERQQILQEVMKGMAANHPLELLQHNINLLKAKHNSSNLDDLVEILEDIADFVEDIDLAKAFLNSGCSLMITEYLKHGSEDIKIACFQLISSLVQNNTDGEKVALEEKWFQTILEIINDSSCPNTVLSSALSPVSTLIRTKDGYQFFMKNNGLQSLISWLSSGIDRCIAKSAFIIYNLIEEDWNRQSDFVSKKLIKAIIPQLKPSHNQTTEMLARSLYCICKNSLASSQYLKASWSELNTNLDSLTNDAKKNGAIEEDIQWYLRIQEFFPLSDYTPKKQLSIETK
ncbi:DgyrCDS10954 [Dimorphilus gyrociliatus]|uniref:DgyrCDS10954 n=1 Tax=Dimorphilus gyrociliatus TaxID=2664684 RepID=A0A7I8W1W9_9ANNE|nr:DgyrCDS10954 [Dimorphilus gyrociliatus]